MLAIVLILAFLVVVLGVDNVRIRMANNSSPQNTNRTAGDSQPPQSMKMVNDLGGQSFKGGAYVVRPPKGVDTTHMKPASAPPSNANPKP